MSGKHEKYAYVRRKDGWYVKLRVLKSRDEKDSSKYVILDLKTRRVPRSFKVIHEKDLPPDVVQKLYQV
ncbi:MAG: DUF5622 domain-containing protein [Acidilobaceae archaeon]